MYKFILPHVSISMIKDWNIQRRVNKKYLRYRYTHGLYHELKYNLSFPEKC